MSKTTHRQKHSSTGRGARLAEFNLVTEQEAKDFFAKMPKPSAETRRVLRIARERVVKQILADDVGIGA